MSADPLSRAVEALACASRLLVVTGAGISAESGIPTFRGAGGLWEGFRAEDLATPQAFSADPELVWRWYRWRLDTCRQANPNAAHRVVVDMEHQWKENFLLTTQNVDGLHPRAGNQRLVELHGNIETARCTACGHTEPLQGDPSDLPHCSRCKALQRPHILWFGESYWPGIIEESVAFAESADAVLVVGTSGRVWPPIAIALRAQECGAALIDVNPNPSEVNALADAWLRGPATQWLPDLWAGVQEAVQ
jgi:NAD-dependent deacetylase